MTRSAISPRFAIRTRRNGGALITPARPSSRRAGRLSRRSSQGNVAVLARRIAVPLPRAERERPDQRGARLVRQDHVVDVAVGGREVGVVEPLLVEGDEPRLFGGRVRGGTDLLAEHDLRGA